MASVRTYVGPSEQVFPHLRGRTSGTLTLTPGEAYELDAFPGPAWWWHPAPPAEDPGKPPETPPDDRWADSRPWAQEEAAEASASTPAAPAAASVPAPRAAVSKAAGDDGAEG